MPDAYQNYTSYVQSVSPMTPGEHENYFTYTHDQRTLTTLGTYRPDIMETSNIETCDLEAQVLNIIGNPEEHNAEFSMCERTDIKIVVQPVDKFRFRYKSEMMGTHGSLLGEREDSNHKKEVPSAQLVNCQVPKAVIRCTLVTADEDRRYPHAHHLVRKDGTGDKDDPHDIEVSSQSNYTAMFCNMGIIHTAKKNIKEEILRKRRIEIIEEKKRINFENATITTREDLEMKLEVEKAQKWMNLNSVALCFQGFSYGENNVLIPITEKVYSRAINNLKSALTGELKICRIDKHSSSCEGNEEVWLLVEKVGKKNIKVKFFEVDTLDNIIWEAEGRFSELDVHHQYAIVLKTPPYKDLNITTTKEVYIKLERPTDGESSNTVPFVYKPSDKVLNRKRPRMTNNSESMDFSVPTQIPRLENCIPMAETYINLNDGISNLSGELKKLLNENPGDSDVLRDFLNDKSLLEKYLSMTSSQTSPCTSDVFVTDGAVSEDFAKETLGKLMKIFKEAESNECSKEDAFNRVGDLLKESTNFGDTPLHFSLRHEQYDIVQYILMILGSQPSFKDIVNLRNSSKKTPLHLAVLLNQPDIVRALLKVGADPNIGDEEDCTALHIAVTADANVSLDELLKSDIKPNLEAHNESGWSALHLAAKVGSLKAVQALINAGANINSIELSYGRTALDIAVDHNHKHIVEYLLENTAINVNTKNFGGNTALHNAVVKSGKYAEELVRLLKKYGADPNIRNNNVNNQDDEEEDNTSTSTVQLRITDSSTMYTIPTIKSENTEPDQERTGESSFDLARDDPKLLKLLSEGPPEVPMDEDLDLKEESEDEIPIEQSPIKVTAITSIAEQLKQQQQLQFLNDEKLTDEHVKSVIPILNQTGEWEKLADHTRHGSLIRLYRKTSNPSAALFNKIRLQNPDITVSQVKKYLIDIRAFEAATALKKE